MELEKYCQTHISLQNRFRYRRERARRKFAKHLVTLLILLSDRVTGIELSFLQRLSPDGRAARLPDGALRRDKGARPLPRGRPRGRAALRPGF